MCIFAALFVADIRVSIHPKFAPLAEVNFDIYFTKLVILLIFLLSVAFWTSDLALRVRVWLNRCSLFVSCEGSKLLMAFLRKINYF